MVSQDRGVVWNTQRKEERTTLSGESPLLPGILDRHHFFYPWR